MGSCCGKASSYQTYNENAVGWTNFEMFFDNFTPFPFRQSEREGTISSEEKRRRAAEAAEIRLQQSQTRGLAGGISEQPRKAHAELPGNVDSNLKWQVK